MSDNHWLIFVKLSLLVKKAHFGIKTTDAEANEKFNVPASAS